MTKPKKPQITTHATPPAVTPVKTNVKNKMFNKQHTYQEWTFDAIDSFFFREARQMDNIGGTGVNSIFPPSPYTVAGALRSLIGDSHEINWLAFRQHQDDPISVHGQSIQLSDFLRTDTLFEKWQLCDVFIQYDGVRLYPLPLFILHKAEAHDPEKDKWYHLEIPEDLIQCDLGTVRLPSLPQEAEAGSKPLENTWVTESVFKKILNREKLNGLEKNKDYFKAADLYDTEERLGIAIDAQRKAVHEGMLYQTQHLRLKETVQIGAITQGLQTVLMPNQQHYMVRLGGEGRIAAVELASCQEQPFIDKPHVDKNDTGNRLILTLTSHADFGNDWMIPDFKEAILTSKQKIWQGTLYGVELEIEACVLGKIQREGGWQQKGQNHRTGQPRAVKTLVPAGSAYYCRVKNKTLSEAITALHGQAIGNDTQLGRGRIAVGLWK